MACTQPGVAAVEEIFVWEQTAYWPRPFAQLRHLRSAGQLCGDRHRPSLCAGTSVWLQWQSDGEAIQLHAPGEEPRQLCEAQGDQQGWQVAVGKTEGFERSHDGECPWILAAYPY